MRCSIIHPGKLTIDSDMYPKNDGLEEDISTMRMFGVHLSFRGCID